MRLHFTWPVVPPEDSPRLHCPRPRSTCCNLCNPAHADAAQLPWNLQLTWSELIQYVTGTDPVLDQNRRSTWPKLFLYLSRICTARVHTASVAALQPCTTYSVCKCNEHDLELVLDDANRFLRYQLECGRAADGPRLAGLDLFKLKSW